MKAIKYLEKQAYIETDEFGETIEYITVTDAITACKIQELESLELMLKISSLEIQNKVIQLKKELKYV